LSSAQSNARILGLLTGRDAPVPAGQRFPERACRSAAQNIAYDCGPTRPHRPDRARIPWFIVYPMIKMLSSESPAGCPDIYA